MSPRSLLLVSLVLIVSALGAGYWWGLHSLPESAPSAAVKPAAPSRPIPVTKVRSAPVDSGVNFSLLGKMFTGDRLHRMSDLIAKLQRAQLEELNNIAHELNQRKENPMNQTELEALHRALGATGGIKALDLLENGEAAAFGLDGRDRSRIAYGWAKVKPDEAGAWVKANAEHSARSDVAFHLALHGVSTDPATSRQWLPFMAGPLQEQAEEVIARYESKRK